MDDLHLDNLHRAMDTLGEALKTPEMDISDSVETLISSEILEKIYQYLVDKNYAGCLFTIAPIRRALTTGSFKSYKAKTKTAFFNTTCEYNLTQLIKTIEAYRDLHEVYEEIQEDFEENML